MRRSSRRAAAALAIFAALTALAGGCGSPLSTADVTDTAQAGVGTIAPSPSAIDLINRKLVQHGEPTIPLDSTPFAPRTGASVVPGMPRTPTDALTPPTTPAPPDCGAGGISGGNEIVATSGSVLGRCGLYGTYLVFTTYGTSTAHGGIGVFECGANDASCRAGGYPEHPGAWSFYPGPMSGSVKVLAFHPTQDELVVDNGGLQTCFNLSTRMYCP
jgi:hypothetical protein